jgi:pSer/pThr/pTyr-binding forkhead associated (FHA) protein
MPVIKVNDQQFSLRPGQNRLGAGQDADVPVIGDTSLGVQAIVEVANERDVVIRRAGSATVRVNGVPLVDPTPLMHGDRVEIGDTELLYADDTKTGATQTLSASNIAAIAKRVGPARATAATGGRLVSLVDGKEYLIEANGITIGRDAASDVVVAQNEVSRKHAEVAPVDAGYEIRDFSSNGVFVNGVRVAQAQILSRSDVIRVGSEEFRFYADVSATNGAAPPAAPATAPEVSSAPVAPREARPVLAVLEVVNEGPTKGTTYEVCVPLAHVGRGAHNDVVIPDESVSDTHSKLQRRDDGWYLVDVGSTNGTYVGGQRISRERRLDGTPDVRFGGVKAIFRANDLVAELGTGTRAIAPVDRAKLRATVAGMPAQVASVAASESMTTQSARGLPVWIWGLVLLAVAAAAAFFMMNR